MDPGQAEELTPAPRPSEPVTSESPRHADSRQTQRSAEESTEAAGGYTQGNIQIYIYVTCHMSLDSALLPNIALLPVVS